MSAPHPDPQHFFGVDMAKQAMVVNAFGTTAVFTLPNRARDIARWLDALPEGSCIGVESTGRLHLGLLHAAHARAIPIYVLNPRRVRDYGRSVSRGAKTDRMDAQIIARYLCREHTGLHPWQPPREPLEDLRGLLKLRDGLVTHATAMRQSARDAGRLDARMRRLLDPLQRAAKALLDEALALARTQPAWKDLLARLRTIPGIGALNSLMLLIALQRHELNHIGAFVAMTGLDPRPCDSGRKVGRRRLSKAGDALLRKGLHTAAMAAVRNPLFAPAYAALQARGLAKIEALVVMARKLTRIAWGIFKSGTRFDPNILALPACSTT